MRSTALRGPLGLGLLATLVAACAPPIAGAARNTFIGKYGCPPAQVAVHERPDLSSPANGPLAGPIFEVTGCGEDVIYACEPGHASTDAIRSRSGWTDASCTPTGWCTEPGCDSIVEAARKAFAADQACREGVGATPRWKDTPIAPPDVAANPERMRVWTLFHEQQTAVHTLVNATGCGKEAVYDCKKAPGIKTIPICKATVPEEPEASSPAPAAGPVTPSAVPMSQAPPTPPPSSPAKTAE